VERDAGVRVATLLAGSRNTGGTKTLSGTSLSNHGLVDWSGGAISYQGSTTIAVTNETDGVWQAQGDETFTSVSPQLSFNFGTGHGWSYLSGGIGRSVWSIHPVGQEPSDADVEPLQTFNYGGGARWFMKTHLAFSFDVRFYAINPGTPFVAGVLGSPRTTLIVIGAGVSVR
jgi:hypothetical protein